MLSQQQAPHRPPAKRCPEGTSLPFDESEDDSAAKDRLENFSRGAVQAGLHITDLPSLHAASVYTPNLSGSALDRCIGLSRMIL
jgi:hypothetical protein